MPSRSAENSCSIRISCIVDGFELVDDFYSKSMVQQRREPRTQSSGQASRLVQNGSVGFTVGRGLNPKPQLFKPVNELGVAGWQSV